MAVRFINPVESEYKSQFVPLPLDFIYGNIQAKQKDLDTARQKVAATEVNVKGTPWWEQGKTNYVKLKQEEYNDKIAAIANRLEMNKEAPQTALSDISKLNREFQEDEIVQTMLRQNKLWEPIAKKAAEDPNAAASFWLDLKQFDPTKKDWVWNDPFSVKDEMIKAPTFAETDKYITDNFGKFLQPQIEEKYGTGSTLVYKPELGKYEVKQADGTYTEVLLDSDLVNNIIPTAIDNYADYLANTDQHAQARVIREGLSYGSDPTPYYGRDVSKHRNLISSVVSKHFRTKILQKPGDVQIIAPVDATTGGGGGGTTPKVEDIEYSTFPGLTIDLSGKTQNLATTTNNLQKGIELRSSNLFNSSISGLMNASPNSPKAAEALVKMDEIFKKVAQDASIVVSQGYADPENLPSNEEQEKIKEILADPSKTFQALFGGSQAGSVEKDAAIMKGLLGERYFNTLRTEIFGVMGDLASSPDKESQKIAEDFWKSYSILEHEQAELKNLNGIIETNGQYFIDKGLELGLFNEEEKKFLSKQDNVEAGETAVKNFKSTLAKALAGDQASIDQLNESVFEEFDVLLGDRPSADLEEGIWHKLRDNQDKIGKRLSEEEFVVEIPKTGEGKSLLSGYTKKMKDFYNENPQNLLPLLQGFSSDLIDPNAVNKNSIAAIFNSSPYKMPGFSLPNDDKKLPANLITDVNLGKLGNSSMPVLYITAKDEKGVSSVVPITFNADNKDDLSKIVYDLITDEDTKVKAFGAELFGRSTMKDGDLAKIGTMFDILKSAGKVNNTEIDFIAGGTPFTLQVKDNQPVIGVKDVNGKFNPLDKISSPDGKNELRNIVDDMDEFLEYMGSFIVNRNLYKAQMSSGGGTTGNISTSPITIGGGTGGATNSGGKSQGGTTPQMNQWY